MAKKRRLGDVVQAIFAGLAAARRQARGGQGNATPVIQVGDINGERVPPSALLATVHLEPATETDRYRVAADDVLLTARGTQLKVAHVAQDSSGAVASSNILVVRPGPELLAPIVFAFVQSQASRTALLRRSRSSTGQLSVSARDVGALMVAVPPLEAQQQMAALLDATERNYQAAREAAETRRRVGHELALTMLSGRT